MGNVIIYSFYARKDIKFKDNIHVFLLDNSIKSIRKFNNVIPIIIYLHCENSADYQLYKKHFQKFGHIQIKYFNPNYFVGQSVTPPKLNKTNWNHVFHKWPNLIDAALTFKPQKILYIDPDTKFYKNPNFLFSLLSDDDKNSVLIKQESFTFEKEEMFFNDGVILTSSEFLKKLKKSYFELFNPFMNALMLKGKSSLKVKAYRQLKWSSWQYVSYLILKNLDFNITFFSKEKVALADEYFQLDSLDSLVLFHHYKYNRFLCEVLPEETLKQLNVDCV